MSRDLILRDAHRAIAASTSCDCASCPLVYDSASNLPQPYGTIAVDNSGNLPADRFDGIVVVGEIPSFNDRRGPLSGRASRNWKEALDKSGLNAFRLLVVPTVHCVPGNVLKSSDRDKAVQKCRPSVTATLAAHPGLPVLLVGQDAMAAVGISAKISAVRGFVYKEGWGAGTKIGRPYIITNSATTVMFGNIYMWGTFIEDLRRFKRLITGTLGPGLLPSMVKTHATLEDSLEFFDYLTEECRNWFAVDIETTAPASTPELGLDPTRATFKTISLGTYDRSISLAWDEADYDLRKFVVDQCSTRNWRQVFHNGPWFDIRVLERYGFSVNNWEDTRDLRRALSSTSRLSLGFLGSLYDDIHAWKLDDNDDKLASSNNLDELLLYNGYDTIVTARIYEKMRQGVGL